MFFTTSGKLKRIIGDAPKQDVEHFYLYNLKLNGTDVKLYVSKKRATKRAHIHCTESGDITWEQFYIFGGMSRPSREKKYILKPTCDKNAATVVVIRGNAGNITRLDEKIKSHHSTMNSNELFLMSERYAIPFLKKISK